jgi:predicted transcriptional regulator
MTEERLKEIKDSIELQRKDNNWNELKEWLKNIAAGNWVEYNEAINDVLDKIKEIENDN